MITSVDDIVSNLLYYWGEENWEIIDENLSHHEANILQIESTKARTELGWRPIWDLDKMLEMTVGWYKNYKNTDIYDYCIEQIRLYKNNL